MVKVSWPQWWCLGNSLSVEHCGDEVVLVGSDALCSCVPAVTVRWDQLEINILELHVDFSCQWMLRCKVVGASVGIPKW